MAKKKEEDEDFSLAVQEAFRKRSKAFKRTHNAIVSLTPVKEIIDGMESEFGRTDISIESRPVTIRLIVWSERTIWLDARCSSKSGWLWEYTDEGRFTSRNGARGLVECVEKTMSVTYKKPSEVPAAISSIWSEYLATGPSLV